MTTADTTRALLLSLLAGDDPAGWYAYLDWLEERGDRGLRVELEGRQPTPYTVVGSHSWRTDACDNGFGRDPFVLPDRVFLRLAGGAASDYPDDPSSLRGAAGPRRPYWRHYPAPAAAFHALRVALVEYALGLEVTP